MALPGKSLSRGTVRGKSWIKKVLYYSRNAPIAWDRTASKVPTRRRVIFLRTRAAPSTWRQITYFTTRAFFRFTYHVTHVFLRRPKRGRQIIDLRTENNLWCKPSLLKAVRQSFPASIGPQTLSTPPPPPNRCRIRRYRGGSTAWVRMCTTTTGMRRRRKARGANRRTVPESCPTRSVLRHPIAHRCDKKEVEGRLSRRKITDPAFDLPVQTPFGGGTKIRAEELVVQTCCPRRRKLVFGWSVLICLALRIFMLS